MTETLPHSRSRSRASSSTARPTPRPTRDSLGLFIEAILYTLLCFAPLAFGSVEPWSELIVETLAISFALCVFMRMALRSNLPVVTTWAYLPLGLFIAFCCFQLLPLPSSVVGVLSPHTLALRKQLLFDLPSSMSRLSAFPISMYPHATAHDLRIVLMAAAVFVAVLNHFRRPEQIKRLLTALCVIGAVVTVIAFIQDISGTGNVYFVGPPGRGRATAGPFIHYSHYSQFTNLVIGAAIGFLLVKLYAVFRHKAFELRELPARWQDIKLQPVWPLAGLIIVATVTIFLSGSRGGMLSSLALFGMVTLILGTVRRAALPGKGWLVTPAILLALGLISFVGIDGVFNRLDSLRQADQTGGRLQMLHDMIAAFRAFPLVGTGLGTHAYVYPMFDTSTLLARASHAENEYFQAMEETGAVGLALILSFAGIVWANVIRAVWSDKGSLQLASIGLGSGLLAVMLHSLSDFGQHIPAVACLTATICGALLCLPRVPATAKSPVKSEGVNRSQTGDQVKVDEPQSARAPARWFVARPMAGFFVAITTVAGMWSVAGAGRIFAASRPWKIAQDHQRLLEKNSWAGTDDEFADMLTNAALAVAADPTDAEHRYFDSLFEWETVSTASRNGAISEADARNRGRLVLDELDVARLSAPVFGPIYCLSGQVENALGDSNLGNAHLEQAYTLSRTDPSACFFAARVDAQAGRWDDAQLKLSRYIALVGGFGDVIQICVDGHRPDLAYEFAKGKVEPLNLLATVLRKDPGETALAQRADAEAFALLREQCSHDDATAEVLLRLASIEIDQKDIVGAIGCYQRAIAQDYGQVDWHLKLAQLLAQNHQVVDAMHEARVCLRLQPEMAGARQLLGDLSVLPAAQTE